MLGISLRSQHTGRTLQYTRSPAIVGMDLQRQGASNYSAGRQIACTPVGSGARSRLSNSGVQRL